MVDLAFLVDAMISGLLIAVLVALLVLMIIGISIAKRVNRLSERLELMTDLKGWLGFIRKLPGFRTKKS